MRKLSRRSLTVALAITLAAGGAAAWAAWTANTTGATTANASTSVPLSVVAATSPSTKLYPGGSGDIVIRIFNGNPFPVRVFSVVKTPKPITADADHAAAGCAGGAIGVSMLHDLVTVNWLVPAGETKQFAMVNEAHMDNSAHNACQGATFVIPVALTATSAS